MDDLELIKQDLLNTIYPKNTHMDFNIASALFHASKGCGYLSQNGGKELFES